MTNRVDQRPLPMTNDRHDPEATHGTHDEFWGEQTEWTPRPLPERKRDGVGAAIGRWWAGLTAGAEHGGRVHGEPRSHRPADDAPFDEGHIAPFDAVIDDDAWELEAEPMPNRQPGIDPLIARLGGLAVVVTLAAPLLLGITASGSEGDAEAGDTLPAAVAGVSSTDGPDAPASSAAQNATASTPIDATATADTAAPTSDAAESDATVAASDRTDADASESAMLEAAPESEFESAATSPTPEPATTPAATVDPCGQDYELGAGDYWIRIADAAGVSLADLLAVNYAAVDTVLGPGRTICLPVGAAPPAPPPTATPSRTPTATAPAGSGTPTQTPATTAAPTTAPTTTSPPRPAAVPESEAAAIIREVWPDELEERALEIAWRESNHRSNVNNFCCYGLFQIYYSVHRSWLASLGIDSAQDLYDPRANAIAAYTLYPRAGGWGPWGG